MLRRSTEVYKVVKHNNIVRRIDLQELGNAIERLSVCASRSDAMDDSSSA
jgi:hypothetical protein